MKLLQHGFRSIRKVEVTLAQLEESQVPPPTRPCEYHSLYLRLKLFFRSGGLISESCLLLTEVYTELWTTFDFCHSSRYFFFLHHHPLLSAVRLVFNVVSVCSCKKFCIEEGSFVSSVCPNRDRKYMHECSVHVTLSRESWRNCLSTATQEPAEE